MIKVLLFGILASEAGLKELEVESISNAKELLDKLQKRFPAFSTYRLQLFVNHKQMSDKQALKNGDEVALIPPFPGG